tara:strand:+ start:489 stop:698 length:210 start_codon:yes stop_codon:yes gene_type:complete
MTRLQLVAAYFEEVRPTDNPVDDLRDEVMDFIEENRDNLELSCNGICYEHSHAKVLQCHTILLRGRKRK